MTEELVALLTRGGMVTAANLFNVFDNVAYNSFDGLDDSRRRFLKAGAANVHLAGSGPALFTLVKGKARAEGIYANLQRQGLRSYLAETLESISSLE